MSALPDNIIDLGTRRMGDDQHERLYYDYRRLLRKILKPTEYVVLDILLDIASDKNQGWCWPGYAGISDRGGGLDPHTISSAIKRLEVLGLVKVERPTGLNGKTSNRYYPMREPTPELVSSLEKIQQSTTGKNPVDRDTSTGKNPVAPLEKIQSNVTEETQSNKTTLAKASGAEAPPKSDISQPVKPEKTDKQEIKPIYQRYREKYETVKDDFKARSGVIGEAWQEITGKPPDFSFLNGLAKEFNSGWKVIDAVLKMASCDVVDDPKAYLRKVLSNGTNKPTNGKTNGFSRPSAEPARNGNWSASTLAAANSPNRPRPPGTG